MINLAGITQRGGAFIRAIPFSGKTFVIQHLPNVLDADDLLGEIIGYEASPQLWDFIHDSQVLRRYVQQSFLKVMGSSLVVGNFEPSFVGLPCAARVAYYPEEYLEHVRLVQKDGPPRKVPAHILLEWAKEYEDYPDTIWLHANQFLADVIELSTGGDTDGHA